MTTKFAGHELLWKAASLSLPACTLWCLEFELHPEGLGSWLAPCRAAEEEALVAKIQLREKVLKLAIMCKKAQAPSLVDLVSASGAAEPSFSEEPAGMQDYLRSLQQRIFKVRLP